MKRRELPIPPTVQIKLTVGDLYYFTSRKKRVELKFIRTSAEGFNFLLANGVVLLKRSVYSVGYANVSLPCKQKTFIVRVPKGLSLQNADGKTLQHHPRTKSEMKAWNKKQAEEG